nr:hypothetical protein [uncultured Prevotella sp.]
MDKRYSTFRLPCLRRLKKTLGEYDALVEYVELATRKFKSDFKSQSGLSFQEFLSSEANKQEICLNNLTLENYESFKNKYYLILPYAAFGSFLSDFKKDFTFLFGEKYDIQKCEIKLEPISKLLEINGFNISIENWSLNLYDYYRLLRNSLAHDSDKKIKDIENLYFSIDKKAIHASFPTLSAPHDIDNLAFDDFILFTANIKYIAERLTLSLEPKIDWVEFSKHNLTLFPKRNKFEKNKDRLIVYVRNVISTNYGLSLDDSEIENIINNLPSE